MTAQANENPLCGPGVLPPKGARIHLVGVCGTGMTPLARTLQAAGWKVSGEDKQWPAEFEAWLRAGGVTRAETGRLPDDAQLLVTSSAVKSSHPTVAAACARGLPVMRRGEILAELVRDRPLIAVVGSHGKTTTTAMLAVTLPAAGIACDYLLGGLFADGRTPPSVWTGVGPVVAEVDESDGTIGGFHPEITVCVNVDWDHCDQYRDPAAIEGTFAALAARTRRAVFYNAACPHSARVFGSVGGSAAVHSFGRGGDFDVREVVDAGASGQTLFLGGGFGGVAARVATGGAFNAVNASAALAVATFLGGADVAEALAYFPGVHRRQAVLADCGGVTVMEDYAHHPAEIDALLAALRARGPRRLVAVFQPHRFSRTAQFKEGFARVLTRADVVHLLEVYPAGEAPIDGGQSADVLAALQAIAGAPPTDLLPDVAAAPAELAARSESGDLLLFVGAGDIDAVARATVAMLERSHTSPAWIAAFRREVMPQLDPQTEVRTGEPLGPKTTIRVGGAAELYAEPATTEDLQTLLRAAKTAGVPVHFLGRGSNLIVPDEGVRGLVIRLQHAHWRRFTRMGAGRFWAGAGLRLKELCGLACKMGEAGFEFLEGIPGTVGGALRMNAGAMGGWIFDRVEQVHFVAMDGTLHMRSREELRVGYRHCDELADAIAVGAVLLSAGHAESDEIRKRIDDLSEHRFATQPREPSAGCIFKNPPGDSAGRIIDQLGLKGLRVGDAEVSPVHGNFIINRGAATGADVITLVRRVRDEVRTRRQIELEPEVLLYGREWREVL